MSQQIKDTDLEGSKRDQGFDAKTGSDIKNEQDTAQKNRDNFMGGVSDRAAGEVDKAKDISAQHDKDMAQKSKKLGKEIDQDMDKGLKNREERMNEVAHHNREVNQP